MAEDNLLLPQGFVPTPVQEEPEDSLLLPQGFVPTPVQEETVEEPDDKNVFQDIGQGLGAGVINIGQGVTELGAAGLDVVFDTDTSRDVTEFFEGTKESLNLTPTGTAGKVAEGLVTFGSVAIPIVGWLGRANAVAKGAKVIPGASKFAKSAEAFGKSASGKALLGNRLKLAASTSLATGAADVFVAPTTFNTMSDSFDALPDFLKTEEDTGLTGSEEGARRFRNKFRFGVEGAAAGAAVETAFPVIGAVARAPAYIPGVPAAARLITSGFDKLGNKLSGGALQKYFTSAGLMPRELYEGIEDVKGVVASTTREAAKKFTAFERAAKKTVKASKLFGKGREGIDKVYTDLQTYLTGGMNEAAFTKLHGAEVGKAAADMRGQVDGLTDIFMKNIEAVPESVLAKPQRDALVAQFAASQGKYLRRMYEVHMRPEEFVKDAKLFEASVKEVAGLIQNKSGLVGDELITEATKVVNQTLYKQTTEGGANVEVTLKQLNSGLKKGNKGGNGQPVPLFKIAQGMLKERNEWMNAAPTLRKLMGEIKDPKELYLRTVGDMSTTLAANQFYRQYADTSMLSLDDALVAINKNPNAKPLAIDGRTVQPDQAEALKRNGYAQLGEFPDLAKQAKMTDAEKALGGQYGAMTGAFVPVEVKEGFTIAARVQDPLQEILAVSLQAKGLSQMTKTVLNPLSHIRNFHSGIFMLGANGNVARDMNLAESARLTIGRLVDMGDAEFAKTFNTLQKAGIVDQNYVVNEFQALLREGADLKVAGKISDGTTSLLKSIPFAQALSKGAQNVYSGTDNFWKTVGFSGEKAKFTNAIRRGIDGTDATMDDVAEAFSRSGLAARTTELTKDMDFMDLMSADIVKSTMPTYSRVPESIKMIRRIPFIGNFVAFPAEIMRTTTNITRQGMRELGFKIDPNSALFAKLGPKKAKEFERQVRAIGAKRLSSYVGMAYMVPVAAQKAAMELTDFTQDQMDALERLSPYFSKGDTLAPIRNEIVDGKPKVDYVNLSYMMPYDFMMAPARAAIQAYSETGEVTESQTRMIGAAMQAAILKATQPFASESLLAERIADVAVRDGKTKTGASIFIDGENPIDRAQKSAIHILGGFTPGAFEMFYRERRGETEAGRVTKALTGDPSRYGEEFTAAEEAASLVTGFREMQTDLDKNFYFNGVEYTSARSSLRSSFTAFAKRNDVTSEDIVERYKQVNQDLLSAQARLYSGMKAAETLGLSKEQIIRQLSVKSKMGREELGAILNGKFRPITLTKNLIKSIMMESLEGQARVTIAEDLPVEKLIELSVELSQLNVDPKTRSSAREVVTEDGLLPAGFVPTPVSVSQTPQPVVQQSQPEPTESFVAPVTNAISGAVDTVGEGFGNLYDRARTFAPSYFGDRKNQSIVDRDRQ